MLTSVDSSEVSGSSWALVVVVLLPESSLTSVCTELDSTTSGVVFEQNSDNLAFGEWSISGTLDYVKSFFNNLNVSTLSPYTKGNFQLSILNQIIKLLI